MKSANVLMLALMALLAVGCSSGTTDDLVTSKPIPTKSGGFRAVNGISDSTAMGVSIPGTATDSQNVAFDAVSPTSLVLAQTYTATVTPSGAASSFTIGNVPVSENSINTVFTSGLIAQNTLTGFAIQQPLTAPAAGQVTIQFVHAAYQATKNFPYFYIALSPVGSGTGQSNGLSATVYYGQQVTLNVPVGTYRISGYFSAMCAPGNACPQIVTSFFDSGPNGIAFPATNSVANIFQLAAIDSSASQSNSSNSPVTMLLTDNLGGSRLLIAGMN